MNYDRQHHLEFCAVCEKRQFSRDKGIVCSLTNECANFQETCPDFIVDEVADKEREEKRKYEEEREIDSETLGLAALGIKNGVAAGSISIIFAIIWFFVGLWFLERVFIYPIFLVFFGIAAIYYGDKRKKEENSKKR